MDKVLIIMDADKLTDESLMQIGLDLGISLEECYRYKVDPNTGDQWQTLDKHAYAVKVKNILLVEVNITEE